jgi:hypothetical protein
MIEIKRTHIRKPTTLAAVLASARGDQGSLSVILTFTAVRARIEPPKEYAFSLIEVTLSSFQAVPW